MSLTEEIKRPFDLYRVLIVLVGTRTELQQVVLRPPRSNRNTSVCLCLSETAYRHLSKDIYLPNIPVHPIGYGIAEKLME